MESRAVNAQKTLVTPVWVFGIRIAQVVLSIVVLGMAAAWSEYALFDAPSLAIAAVRDFSRVPYRPTPHTNTLARPSSPGPLSPTSSSPKRFMLPTSFTASTPSSSWMLS